MEIKQITLEEYEKICLKPNLVVYNDARFIELNQKKVKKINYYSLTDGKCYFVFSVGERDNGCVYAPYSAPFAIVEPVRKRWDLKHLDESVICMDNLLKSQFKGVEFVLPPAFYAPKLVTGFMSALLRHGYSVKWQDLNYAFDLCKINDKNYSDVVRNNARKNLRIANEKGLSITQCNDIQDKKKAYDIISVNRKEKGYPLRMTWQQVKDTLEIVPNDFFLVHKDGNYIASAVVFHVAENIVQVIYWGNISEYSYLKPMNYLAYELIRFYGEKGFRYIDIGPSSEEGVPNYGLCDFKDSIGCEVASKFVLSKIFAK